MMDLREPIIRAALQTLNLPPGSRGLDVGCGVGIITQSLAKSVSPIGHVTGLDVSPEQITFAREYAINSEMSNWISDRMRK